MKQLARHESRLKLNVYLIAEELLVEAIEAEENLFSTAMLFAGFLVPAGFQVDHEISN